VGGEDYAIIAASTRMSTSFSILTRHSSKFTQLCGLNLRQMLAPLCHQSTVQCCHHGLCSLSYATSAIGTWWGRMHSGPALTSA